MRRRLQDGGGKKRKSMWNKNGKGKKRRNEENGTKISTKKRKMKVKPINNHVNPKNKQKQTSIEKTK